MRGARKACSCCSVRNCTSSWRCRMSTVFCSASCTANSSAARRCDANRCNWRAVCKAGGSSPCLTCTSLTLSWVLVGDAPTAVNMIWPGRDIKSANSPDTLSICVFNTATVLRSSASKRSKASTSAFFGKRPIHCCNCFCNSATVSCTGISGMKDCAVSPKPVNLVANGSASCSSLAAASSSSFASLY